MMSDDVRPSRSVGQGVWLVLALVAGVAAIPRLLGPSRMGGRAAAGLVGHPAPSFELPIVANGSDARASRLQLAALRGEPVLLDFWATWCGPCRMQGPIVDAVARRFHDRGLAVVGIATDGPGQGDPGAVARAEGLTYAVVHDDSGRTSHDYGVEVLPTLVLVSRSGEVLAVRTGITDAGELDRLVEQAL